MHAIIESGGKQYRVKKGDLLEVEKLEAKEEDVVELDRVLAIIDKGRFIWGNPLVEKARVLAKVTERGKGEKITVFKYKPKKNYHRKIGHRQLVTYLRVEKIDADIKSAITASRENKPQMKTNKTTD